MFIRVGRNDPARGGAFDRQLVGKPVHLSIELGSLAGGADEPLGRLTGILRNQESGPFRVLRRQTGWEHRCGHDALMSLAIQTGTESCNMSLPGRDARGMFQR